MKERRQSLVHRKDQESSETHTDAMSVKDTDGLSRLDKSNRLYDKGTGNFSYGLS